MAAKTAKWRSESWRGLSIKLKSLKWRGGEGDSAPHGVAGSGV